MFLLTLPLPVTPAVKKMTAFDVFGEEFDFWARMVRGTRHHEEWLSILPASSDRVLDVGCGSGFLCLSLADRVNNVVGVDISQKMIQLAKKYKAEQRKNNVHFVRKSLLLVLGNY